MRRISGRVSEGVLATIGAIVTLAGFSLIVHAVHKESAPLLLTALAVVVSGFAFTQPSLNSLLSRRSDPAQQGAILGVGQSVNSLARIFGALFGIPLLKLGITLPFLVASGLMAVGIVFILLAVRGGKDFSPEVT